MVIFVSWDAEYWEKMTSVIDSSKEHVWDALSEGFEKYLSVLTERAALIQETDALEQQVIVHTRLLYVPQAFIM